MANRAASLVFMTLQPHLVSAAAVELHAARVFHVGQRTVQKLCASRDEEILAAILQEVLAYREMADDTTLRTALGVSTDAESRLRCPSGP
jgi:hypothetical protein